MTNNNHGFGTHLAHTKLALPRNTRRRAGAARKAKPMPVHGTVHPPAAGNGSRMLVGMNQYLSLSMLTEPHPIYEGRRSQLSRVRRKAREQLEEDHP